MRYLKSAAFLLLTASSSVSLLSQSAKAALEEPLSSYPDAGVSMVASSAIAPTSSDAITPQQTTTDIVTPSAPQPLVSEVPTPKFDQLRARLLVQTLPPTAIDVASAPAEKADTDPTAIPSLESQSVESPPVEDQPDTFAKPGLTIESFRNMVEETESQENRPGFAQETNTDNEADTLPALENPAPEDSEEADTPAQDPALVDPALDSPSDPSADIERPYPLSDSPSAGPDESIPDPATSSDEEIGELPAILFADPNPLSVPTSAEEIDINQNPVITLEQAVELAYRNNQTLQAALLSEQQAAAALAEARAALLPSVSSGASITSQESTQPADIPGLGAIGEASGLDTTLSGSVDLSYDVLTGGSRGANIRAAELQQQISALSVEAQQEEIRLTTANLYYALQEAGENIRINQSFLDEAARNLRDAQLRQEVGVGTRFDVLRAEVQFANARQSLIQSQSQQQISRRDISRLLNLPPTASISATPVEASEVWPLTLDESILQAFQNRAELEQQLLQADVSEQQRLAALATVRPQVSLFANYSLQSLLDDNDGFQDNYSFGARLNWTLFDGGAARSRARQQEIAGQISEEQFSETLDQVRFDVEQAYFNLQSNRENIATSQVAVAQAQEALDLANLRLQAGVGTQLDVLTAQRELTEAEVNNVTAILGYNRALVAIQRAISNVTVDLL
ncbi:MAG: TolC family protein [Phormidesmis sp.]